MDDRELVQLFLERDEQAIALTAKQYGTYCKSIAAHILRSGEDTEECLSDAFLKLWQTIPPNSPRSLKAYLGRITRNLAIDRYRLAAVEKRGDVIALPIEELADLAPSELNVETEAELSALREHLGSFVGSLTSEDRIIFVQRYWYMLDIKEIAEKNGMGKSKVKMRLLRTRGRLREYLIKEGYEL